MNIRKISIDFNKLLIEGKSINDFMYSKIRHTYSYNNWNDLSGIPLTNIRLQNAIISNAQLSLAIFDNSFFFNVEFYNCNLNECSFKNCHAACLRIGDERGAFSNCDWHGSIVNSIDISYKNLGLNPLYNKISYFKLILVALKGDIQRYSKHTDFGACTIFDDNFNYQFKKHIDYINWYQSTMLKYGRVRSEHRRFIRFFSKTGNFINALSTMNWYSPFATLFTGGLVIIVFSLFYFFFFKEYFFQIENYFQSLNFSIQIFTSLGYGDIKPDLSKGIIGLSIVSFECALGYVWLALTIMVLGKRIYR